MKKVLEVLIFAFFVLFCISLCMIDGESMKPLIFTGVSMAGILVCNILYRRKL